jgi:hypothetical protein
MLASFDAIQGASMGVYGRSGGFSPVSLFASGEDGVVFDPLDISTFFQDSLGTTPVTTSPEYFGLMLDKSKGLVRGPQLVTNGGFASDADWTKGTGWTIAGGVASFDASVGGTGVASSIAQSTTTVAGESYIVEFEISNIVGLKENMFFLQVGGANLSPLGTSGDLAVAGTYSVIIVAGSTTTDVAARPNTNVISTVNFDVDNVSIRSLAGNHARQATAAARLRRVVAANGDVVLENNEINDSMSVTFPNMGTSCTVAFVTQGSVYLEEDITLNGAYTLPQRDLLGFVAIDRALTVVEKIQLIRYLASKAQGVNYGVDLGAMALAAINAVDVFVYDTTKDTDGGAWVNGTLAQASSWYSETLNTATRGATRPFPAQAMIVAEAGKVTIYDATDPDLPMWRVSGSFTVGSGNIKAVTANNGVVTITDSRGSGIGYGVLVANFISDRFDRYANTTDAHRSLVGISNDATTASYQGGTLNPASYIPSAYINDVAMTVLPDAPIDPATGLQVPTIAVATNGGTSVIPDSMDGTVADSGNTDTHAYAAWVDDGLWFGNDTQMSFSTYADIAAGDGFGDIELSTSSAYPLQMMTRIRTDFINVGNDIAFCGNVAPLGLQIISPDYDSFAPNNKASLSAFITSTYNTGWMHGDIKGAWLSSTDDTDLVGTELVTNGDFATDSDWTKGTGWTIGSGVATADASATSNTEIIQTVDTVAGEKYLISWELVSRSAGSVRARVAGIDNGPNETSLGVYSFYFTANSTTTSLGIQDTVGSFVGSVDNISVRLADPDRSVNGNGLATYGTITKTAVATGAELMAYSGFSASNYLEQPYNSDLDFGTGDFHVMGWIKTAGNEVVVGRFDKLSGTPNWDVRVLTGDLTFVINGANKLTPSIVVTTDTWVQFCVLRASGVLYSYINGVLDSSALNTQNLNNTSASLGVGARVQASVDKPFAGSIALLRIGAGAPTAAQVLEIYNGELPRFQENCADTIFGASDAVTALAHDPDTDLLHVGTSAGRSVFRGLERINNTSTSISTAISASGGLIVEK